MKDLRIEVLNIVNVELRDGACKVCLGHGREIDGDQQLDICLDCGLYSYDPSQCVDCLTNACVDCDGSGDEEK